VSPSSSRRLWSTFPPWDAAARHRCVSRTSLLSFSPKSGLGSPLGGINYGSGKQPPEAGARVKEAQFVSDRRESKTSGDDKREGTMDKAKGRLKEATGALTGDKNKKAEGRSDQRSGTMKEKKGHLKDLFK